MKIMLLNFMKVVNSAGGAERVFCNMSNEFVKRNYDVYAVCCDWENGRPFYSFDDRVRFINIDGSGIQTKFAKYLKFAREVLRLFKKVSNDNPYDNVKNKYWSTKLEPVIDEIKPDIIIAYDLQGVCILKNILNIKVPVIAMCHSNTHLMLNVYSSKNEIEALSKVDCIQVLLKYDIKVVQNYFQVPVVQIPNVIPFYDSKADLAENKKIYKIIYIGRLDKKQKRPHLLIKAFAEIKDEFPNWQVEIWGGCSDVKYHNELIKLIKDNKAEKVIKLCGATQNVLKVLLNSDIFAFPSAYEGFGLALGEAMSAGLPCIGFKSSPAVNELIKDNETGILTEDGAEAFAAGLKKLMLNRDLRIKFSAGAKDAMKEYNAKAVWDKWEKLIHEYA